MRTLKFIVDGLTISADPNCDFDNLVPGTEGYLKAEFSFSPDWDGYVKVAGFYSAMGVEYTPQQIKDNCCMIPADALQKRVFKIKIVGSNGTSKMQTDKVTVRQMGGKT